MKGKMGGLFKEAQKLQGKIARAQEELDGIMVESSSGGGMVTVQANAKQEIVSIKIDKEVVDPEDIEMLEDLVLAAVNQALEKGGDAANEHLQKAAGGLMGNLPPGMKLPGM